MFSLIALYFEYRKLAAASLMPTAATAQPANDAYAAKPMKLAA